MHHSKMSPEVRRLIAEGTVIPAHPLALDARRKLDTPHQRALRRYYIAAGAGGWRSACTRRNSRSVMSGCTSRCLRLPPRPRRLDKRPLATLAGLVGRTSQAIAEAKISRGIGYHAGLLSLAAWGSASEEEIVAHCEAVAREIPLVGFYLQPAVGG